MHSAIGRGGGRVTCFGVADRRGEGAWRRMEQRLPVDQFHSSLPLQFRFVWATRCFEKSCPSAFDRRWSCREPRIMFTNRRNNSTRRSHVSDLSCANIATRNRQELHYAVQTGFVIRHCIATNPRLTPLLPLVCWRYLQRSWRKPPGPPASVPRRSSSAPK